MRNAYKNECPLCAPECGDYVITDSICWEKGEKTGVPYLAPECVDSVITDSIGFEKGEKRM